VLVSAIIGELYQWYDLNENLAAIPAGRRAPGLVQGQGGVDRRGSEQ
jgi:hypothetical protein